jgi:hypothetical protein
VQGGNDLIISDKEANRKTFVGDRASNNNSEQVAVLFGVIEWLAGFVCRIYAPLFGFL